MLLPYDIQTVLDSLDDIIFPGLTPIDQPTCFRAIDLGDCSSISFQDLTDWDSYFFRSGLYNYEADVRLYYIDCFGNRILLCEYLNTGINSSGVYSLYTATCPSKNCSINFVQKNGQEYLIDGEYCFEMTVRALDQNTGEIVTTVTLEDCVYIICGSECIKCLRPDVVDRIANGSCLINKYSVIGRDYGSIEYDIKKLNNIMFLLDEYCLTKDECEEIRCAVEKIKSYKCK